MPKNKVDFELLPCPFCGSEVSIENGLTAYLVVCDCGSHMFWGCERDYYQTAVAWQKRANGREVNNG